MPNRYYIDVKNNLRQVPKEKEDAFLKKYPGSRLATDKELTDFEDKQAKNNELTQREGNIQSRQGGYTAKSSTNQPLESQNTSFGTNQFPIDIPNYEEKFKNLKPELSLRQPDNTPTKIFSGNSPFASKTMEQQIGDTMQNMPVSSEAYFDMAVDRYKQERDYIEQIKNDNTLSESVKQSLINDYQTNIRTSDETIEDKHLPPAAKEWLERNKVSREVTRYNPSMMGGGSYTTTVRENTPEQIAFIKDYIANSAEGKQYAQAHKEFIGQLESQADTLLDEVNSIRDKSAKDKEAYAKRHNTSTFFLKGTNYRNDAILDKAANLLKNSKLLLASNREGGGFWKGLHMTNEDLKELAVITESFYNDKVLNQVIDKYQKDPSSLSKEENIIIQAKYIADQMSAGVDPGSWYNIGATTKQSLPFMRDFILTAPIGGGVASGVKGGLSALASKTGANFLLSRGAGGVVSNLAKGAIDLSVRPAVQTMFSPSSYAMAFEEMQGQAINKDAQGNITFDNRKTAGHGMTSALIENHSEVMGEIVFDKLLQKFKIPMPKIFKTRAAQRLSSATGIQGPISEYLEEKHGDLLNIVRGEQTIEGFFDPRQNLETFGAVAIMQIPFSGINSIGYGIGKIQDAQAKRAIRQTYDKSRTNLNEYFGEEAEIAIENFNSLVDNSTEEELQNELVSVIEDERLDDNAKRAIVEYVTSYSAYSGVNKAKQEEVQQAQEEVTQQVQENVNPDMDAIVMAKVGGYEDPVQIWNGHIEYNEDGTINREKSSQSVTIINKDGKKVPVSINFVEELVENIPTEEATAQLSELATQEVTARQENDEVREYQAGERVRTIDGAIGRVAENEDGSVMTDDNGNYIVLVDTPAGPQQIATEPRNIINEDNLIGVENGSEVTYTNEQGEKTEGVVSTTPDLYAQGLIGFENGDVIPIVNVEGLKQEDDMQLPPPPADMMIGENGAEPYNPNKSNSQESTDLVEQNKQNATTAPSEQNILSLDELPKDEKGNILFDQVSAENTLSALGEVYDSSEIPSVIDATIANITKQVEKIQTPKPTGDITKDIASKRLANEQANVLNKRLTYWNEVRDTIQASKPIKQQVTEQLTGEDTIETPATTIENKKEETTKPKTPKRPTPFQRRLNAVEDNVSTVRDRILFGIASGAYKFRWKDKGVSMGLAREMGLLDSQTERRSRIGLLSNEGYSPATLAEAIRADSQVEVNDNDVRSEIIDILSTITSRKQALETLESTLNVDENAYHQEQEEAYIQEQEDIRKEQELQQALIDEINAEEIDNLLNLAKDLGLEPSELGEVYTTFDLVEQLRELEDGQKDILTRGNETDERQNRSSESTGIETDTTERTVGERNRSTEKTGDRTSDRDSQNDYSNLTTEEQAVVDTASNEIDAEIAEVEASIRAKQTELQNKRKELGKEYAKENQTDLFPTEKTSDNLFDVDADFSKQNIESIIKPIENELSSLVNKGRDLMNSKSKRISDALENFRKQRNLFENENPSVVFQNKLKEKFPNGVKLYHRTTAENWASIQNDGQLDVSEEVYGIHTVLGDPNINRVGGNDMVILEINVPIEQYDRLYPEEATYWEDFSESNAKFDNNDMLFDTYMKANPNLIGGDMIYADNVPLSMLKVYEPTIHDKIARAEAETDTNPTEAQKKAGNYRKGKVNIQGFDLTIEQPKGSERSGTDENGNAWSVTMQNTYGYIRGTEGKDGDHIDIFLGNNPDSQVVYVVDQVNDKGEFDEHKVMFGFNSMAEARDAYLSNYSQGWQGMGEVTGVDIESFRKWTESDSRKIKPFAEYADIKKQSSTTRFTPIKEDKFNDLVDRLKQTGLAKDVITDKESFDKKLSEVIDNGAVAKQMLSEMESIKQESIANNTFMLAPNGEKTNLSEAQWLQVRTTNFKNWFGDWVNDPANASKVVDENGEPLVVYHGTDAEFTEFIRATNTPEYLGEGIYFSSERNIAEQYGGNMVETYLNLREPQEFIAGGKGFNSVADELIPYLKNLGKFDNDGLVIKAIRDVPDGEIRGVKSTVYVADDPTQIKSAISNNGEFSVENADIRMQVYESSLQDFRDAHTAPSMDYDTLLEANEESGDVSLSEIITGKQGIVPDDFFDTRIGSFNSGRKGFVGAIRYGYDTKAGNESINAIKALRDKLAKVEDAQKLTARVYRAVPNSVSEDTLVNRDWITLSKEYANDHGLSRFGEGEYKIIEQDVPLNKIWWDGNDINEFGYDTTENTRFMRTSQGEVYGFVTPEGEVYLDSTRMNANTPIHEFGHLWNTFTKENNAELYNRGAELIQESEYWDVVNSNPAYAHLSQEAKIDEAMAMAIGDKGEGFVNRNRKQRFVDWLADVWKSIKKTFGINSDISIEDMSLSDFTDRAVSDLLGGKELSSTPSNTSSDIRLQSVDDVNAATEELDSKVKGLFFRFREGWEDSMLAVKRFQEVLEKHGTKIDEYNNFYLKATHMRSINQAQEELYKETIEKPLESAISKIIEKGYVLRDVENYAILKHGLERNEVMRQKAIDKYKEANPDATIEQIASYESRLPNDYSGVTAVEDEVGKHAEWYISDFEDAVGSDLIDDFWKKIKTATQFSLKKDLEGQRISKKQYEDVSSQFEYYIPLRGHDDIVAEDKYDYTPNMGTYFSNPLIQANGRRSRSEKPFAFITQMAMSSISASNQNVEKQKILRLALKDKTGLMRVSKAWYEHKGQIEGEDVWEKVQPTYSSNAEEFQKNIEDFETRMQELAEQGKATQKRDKLKLGMFIKPSQAQQHEVHVTQNGVDYVIYINANPAVARAINGDNLVHLGKIAESFTDVSRFMAANFTTRNPLFIAKNFQRDYTYASSILTVKESAKYALEFQKNIPDAAGALQRYLRGAADLTKAQDNFLVEFIMNGGKTGFSHMLELQELQKAFEKGLKKIDKKDYLRNILDVLEAGNEFAENLSRLSVYITSRKEGRSITKSISDAKNVTVNFNKGGSGQMGAAYIRPLYLFANAAIQSISNKAHVAKNNPKKAAALFAFNAIAPTLIGMALASLIGGDDGLEDYLNMNEWERQNHLLIYTGNGFIKWSLPHELRVWNRIGDNFVQAYHGKKDYAEAIKEIPFSFSDLLPIDPTAASDASWAEFAPDPIRAAAQLAANRNFMGGRIYNQYADKYDPGYKQARVNKKGNVIAPKLLVEATKKLDHFTGGDGVQRGGISLNPDLVEHFARGYFGGLYTFLIRSANTVAGLTGDDELSIRDTPLKDFFVSSEDIQVSNSSVNKKFYNIKEKLSEIEHDFKGYEKQGNKGEITKEQFDQKIDKLSSDMNRYFRVYPIVHEITKAENALKLLEGEKQRELENKITDLKKQVIELNETK